MNIPNIAQAPYLPPDVVVETMCTVDGDGVRGRDEIVPPAVCAAWIRRHVEVQELTVEAALAGDRDAVRAAMALDPLCGRADLRDIEAMTDELLDRDRGLAAAVRVTPVGRQTTVAGGWTELTIVMGTTTSSSPATSHKLRVVHDNSVPCTVPVVVSTATSDPTNVFTSGVTVMGSRSTAALRARVADGALTVHTPDISRLSSYLPLSAPASTDGRARASRVSRCQQPTSACRR